MLVEHIFAESPKLPSLPDGILYQYVVASNGVFVRAARPGLSVMRRLPSLYEPIRGLASVDSYFKLDYPLVPQNGVIEILKRSLSASPQEILFYLAPPHVPTWPWAMIVPRQVRSAGSARPVDPDNPFRQAALIELHSHHSMDAHFSPTDDHDETGFRIYAVVGNINTAHPHISVRLGVYGHFFEIDAGQVFDLPYFVKDEYSIPEMIYDYSYDPA